jgi:phosphomannomutase/phosphoglucomutase
LTTDTVATLARAIGTFFQENGAKRIAIGYDARESSPGFCEHPGKRPQQHGCDAVLIGMVPTPVLYFSTFKLDVDGGVMITGSHNPADHNGFKICLGKSTLYGPQIQRIRGIAESGEFAAGTGTREQADRSRIIAERSCPALDLAAARSGPLSTQETEWAV